MSIAYRHLLYRLATEGKSGKKIALGTACDEEKLDLEYSYFKFRTDRPDFALFPHGICLGFGLIVVRTYNTRR